MATNIVVGGEVAQVASSHLFLTVLLGTDMLAGMEGVKDLKPVVVRGPGGLSSGTARVVVDESRVVVVTQKDVRRFTHDGTGLVSQNSPTKFRVALTGAETGEELTVVKAGGCTCGKPWLKQGSAADLLDPVAV